FGVPSGTARSVPATTSEPGARSLSGARSSPAADSPPGNESPPGAGSSVLVESPAAVLENQLGIMATDAYAPSARLRALIVARDQTCRFPTCQVPAWRCQLDHIQAFNNQLPAWAQTTEANLHALCTHHHQRKTSGELTPERDTRTGITTWRTPTGHLYSRAPEPADYIAVTAHLQHSTQLVICEPPPKPSVDPATLPTVYLGGEASEPHGYETHRRASTSKTTGDAAGGTAGEAISGAATTDDARESGRALDPYGEPPF